MPSLQLHQRSTTLRTRPPRRPRPLVLALHPLSKPRLECTLHLPNTPPSDVLKPPSFSDLTIPESIPESVLRLLPEANTLRPQKSNDMAHHNSSSSSSSSHNSHTTRATHQTRSTLRENMQGYRQGHLLVRMLRNLDRTDLCHHGRWTLGGLQGQKMRMAAGRKACGPYQVWSMATGPA
jgi:hypothetical protein